MALVGAAWGLRLLGLHYGGLGLDVGWALGLAWLPVDQMLDLTARDAHPPLLYLALRGWGELAGASSLATQYLAIAVSTASVALVYAVAARMGGGTVGLLSAAFLACSPYHLYYTKSRYPVPIFFTLLSVFLLLRLLHDERAVPARGMAAVRRWVPYSLVVLVSLYVSYFSVAPLAGQGLYLALKGRWRVGGRWLVAMAAVGAAFLPWASFVLQRHLGTSWGAWGGEGPPYWPLDPFSGDLARSLSFFIALEPLLTPPLWSYTLACGVLLALAWLAQRRPGALRLRAAGLLACVLGASIAFASLATVYWTRGGLGGRYPALGVVPFLILLAYGVVVLLGGRRRLLLPLAGLLVALWLGVHAVQVQVRPDPDDLETIAQLREFALANVAAADEAVFSTPPYGGYYQSWFGSRRSWAVVMADPFFFRPLPPEAVRQAADRLLERAKENHRALWVFYLGGSNAVNEPLRARLREEAYPAGHEWFPYILTIGYSLPRQPMVSARTPLAFRGGVELEAASYTPEAQAGGSLNIALAWRTSQPVTTSYKVFVHLVDEEGHLWAQHIDYPDNAERPTIEWTPGDLVRDHHGLLLPPDLPPGQYRLLLGLSSGQGRLPLLSGSDNAELGTVRIHPA